MGRQESKNDHDDPSVVVVNSSIALLQERFRQLQKVKEMREERELVKLLSLSNSHNKKQFHDHDQFMMMRFFPNHRRHHHHDHRLMMMMVQSSPTTTTNSTTTCLSLWPASCSPGVEKKAAADVHDQVPILMDLWPTADHRHHTSTSSSNTTTSSCDSVISLISKLDDHDDDHCNSDSDVDTSLHL